MPGDPTLDVWMYGRPVAEARRGKRPGLVDLRYTAAAIETVGLNVPWLSCSLLTDTRWADATAFLSGLLPEGRARDDMARIAKVPAFDVHALLARFGRDSAGAITIVPRGEDPTSSGAAAEYYTEESLAAAIEDLDDNPLGLQDDSQLSLPGLQEKLLLIQTGTATGWARPIGGEPSTHILKRDHSTYVGVVEMEAHCLRLARRLGLTSIDPIVVAGDPRGYLIVERYDRVIDDAGVVARVHQEDLCQATGTNTFIYPKAKAEGAGGPRLAQLGSLLATYSADPEAQLLQLLRSVAFTVAIGNADAHGKNMSMLHHPEGVISLAPLYDTVPTMVWPKLKTELGMYIGGATDIRHVTRKHLLVEAAGWGIPNGAATAVIDAFAADLDAVLAEANLPGPLLQVVTTQAAALAK